MTYGAQEMVCFSLKFPLHRLPLPQCPSPGMPKFLEGRSVCKFLVQIFLPAACIQSLPTTWPLDAWECSCPKYASQMLEIRGLN